MTDLLKPEPGDTVAVRSGYGRGRRGLVVALHPSHVEFSDPQVYVRLDGDKRPRYFWRHRLLVVDRKGVPA